ncbi:MAG TPA: DNA polymerase III subunit gamma/tau, partial [Ferruginibacter sp.]|nr:DNA polymerase III subunit gamma/tau [Ferruginibacter sp.]
EAEINYKQARNKRLHVELALIKLCYLLQAVELTDSNGAVAKKKRIESARPVAFRKLPIVALKEEPAAKHLPRKMYPKPNWSLNRKRQLHHR